MGTQKRKKRWLVIGIGIVFLLCVVAVGLYFVFQPRNAAPSQAEITKQDISHANELVASGDIEGAATYLVSKATETTDNHIAVRYLNQASIIMADADNLDKATEYAALAGERVPYEKQYITDSPYSAYEIIRDAKARLNAGYLNIENKDEQYNTKTNDSESVAVLYEDLRQYARAIEYYRMTLGFYEGLADESDLTYLRDKIVALEARL